MWHMDAALPVATTTFRASALLLGARMDLRAWPEGETLARVPLAAPVPGGGVAVLYRYGVAVFFDAAPEAQALYVARLAPLIERRYDSPELEELELRVDPARAEGILEGALVVQSTSVEKLQLLADILSKSVLLAHYESRIAVDFDRIEPFAFELEQTGRIRGRTREHVRRIGALLLIEQRMVGRAEIGDKPELLWDHPELERLYALLEAEYELRERLAALERKLALAARTLRTLVDLLNTRHSLRVEWYIVALIVVEILFTIYQLWLR